MIYVKKKMCSKFEVEISYYILHQVDGPYLVKQLIGDLSGSEDARRNTKKTIIRQLSDYPYKYNDGVLVSNDSNAINNLMHLFIS